MKNQFRIVDEGVEFDCYLYSSDVKKPLPVVVDKTDFAVISSIEGEWELCFAMDKGIADEELLRFEGVNMPLIIGAIVHGTFVNLRDVLAGKQEIPTSAPTEIPTLTTEEYISYLNSHSVVYSTGPKNFVTLLTHKIVGAHNDEGVVAINGNPYDCRTINLRKVKIKGVTHRMALAAYEDDFLYKRIR